MLYIDGISLSKIVKELKEELVGLKIGRVKQYSNLSLSIFFGRRNLYFSANTKLPICYIRSEKEDSLDIPMKFSLTLKKYLLSSTLIDIKQIGFDRIVAFSFKKLNELGESKRFHLIFEIMGKHSNVFLLSDEKKIIDTLKGYSLDDKNIRNLFQGEVYTLPFKSRKKDPTTLTEDELEGIIKRGKLLEEVEGIGRESAKYIKSYEDLEKLLNCEKTPRIYKNDKVMGYILPFEIDGEYTEYSSIQEMIQDYEVQDGSADTYHTLYKSLLGKVKNALKKKKKLVKIIGGDIEKNEVYEKYKEIGDILSANMYQLKRGMDKFSTYDFYNNSEIVITLNDRKAPNENIETYYKRYQKAKRGYEFNLTRLNEIKNEVKYLEDLVSFLDGATSKEELLSIEGELEEEGIIKKIKRSKEKKKKKKGGYRTFESNGIKLLYGRTNLENDYLTMKIAGREDMWFHVKDIPGGHVILKEEYTHLDMGIELGMKLAANLSKVNIGEVVTVDYTRKKHLKKPKGSKPGGVIYHIFESVSVKKEEIKEI